jgi:type II restriction enzyme
MTTIDISEEKIARESSALLKILLKDRTTNKSIVWATRSYELLGKGFTNKDHVTPSRITGDYASLIQPRSEKSKTEQKDRTKIRAEVFTPTWLVKLQNGYAEKELQHLDLESYVNIKWLEITCGEAPYMVTRYDTVTGDEIAIQERVGFVDKKLQRISKEVDEEERFYDLVLAAFKASYGYEFQGDSLLLARENLLATFEDYYLMKFGKVPSTKKKEEIANIISYNVFQMDGLKKTTPFSNNTTTVIQLDLFEDVPEMEQTEPRKTRIKDWNKNKMIDFESLSSEESGMKFDVVIGNPPYQEEAQGTSDKPIYNHFIDESQKISEKALLITPARFLFNAGKTSKAWNKKILSNPHFKVEYYQQDSSKIFPGTDIKGGVAISYFDQEKNFGEIETFTAYQELSSIYKKVFHSKNFESLSEIVFSPESYKLTQELHFDFPEIENRLSKGHKFDVTTNIFEKLFDVVTDTKVEKDSVQLLGRLDGERIYKFIPRKYISGPQNLDNYKVFLPKANGSGLLGETLSTPLVSPPSQGHTQTFISIGCFSSIYEAEALLKYIKTKFVRTLLGVVKVTQDNKKSTWKYVPVQDFSKNSDIDWESDLNEIDNYLFLKYNLTSKEVSFIQNNIKPME